MFVLCTRNGFWERDPAWRFPNGTQETQEAFDERMYRRAMQLMCWSFGDHLGNAAVLFYR